MSSNEDYDDYDIEACMDCGRPFKAARCEPNTALCYDCQCLHLDGEPEPKPVRNLCCVLRKHKG